jgi:hypothetical protein
MTNKPWVANLTWKEKLFRAEVIRKSAAQKWTEAGCPPGRYADFWHQAEEEYDWRLFRRWEEKPFAFLTAPPVQAHQPTAGRDSNVHGIPDPNARRIHPSP